MNRNSVIRGDTNSPLHFPKHGLMNRKSIARNKKNVQISKHGTSFGDTISFKRFTINDLIH